MNELAKFEVWIWSAILYGLFYGQALEIVASPPAPYGHFYTTPRIWFPCRLAPYLVQSHNCWLNYSLGHLVQVEVCTTCRCSVLCVPLTSVTRWHSNSRGARPSPFSAHNSWRTETKKELSYSDQCRMENQTQPVSCPCEKEVQFNIILKRVLL